MTTMPEANAKFALDFFQTLTREHPCDNVLISPVNLVSGFGLLAYGSGCEQAADIEKVLHWDELAECSRPRNRRYLAAAKSFGRSSTWLRSTKVQEKTDTCPRPRPCPTPARPEPTCPRPRPEPTCPRPRPEPTCPRPRPEPACPRPRPEPCPRPRPRPCPEPAPCPERCVPDYECEKPEGVHTAFSKILAALNKPSVNYTLSFANKLYGDHAIAFIQKFMYCALKLYLTDVENVDLHNAPEEVRRLINLWVEVRTHGKIKDLLPKNSFDCLAQLLLVNALYFKGQWDVKFDKELTKEAPFYGHYDDRRACNNVLLMNRRGIYDIATVDLCDVQVQVLEMPYKDQEISFYILLPTDCSLEALEKLEDGLTHEHLHDWSCDLKPEDVDVYIPKFSLERSLEATHYVNLPELTDPEKADFSGATTTEHVALTQFVHDTFFEVDEEGGEPAEAPHCPRDRRPRREPIVFRADHPFLYYAFHHCTQSVLVLGRFSKPE